VDGSNISSKGFFHGYDVVAIAVVVNLGIAGLLVAFIIRISSNLAKTYCVSLSVFVTPALAWYYLNDTTGVSLSWIIAAVVVFVSILMFTDPNLPTSDNRSRDHDLKDPQDRTIDTGGVSESHIDETAVNGYNSGVTALATMVTSNQG
jgi:hypothetical protein